MVHFFCVWVVLWKVGFVIRAGVGLMSSALPDVSSVIDSGIVRPVPNILSQHTTLLTGRLNKHTLCQSRILPEPKQNSDIAGFRSGVQDVADGPVLANRLSRSAFFR